jgi:hypothetical protein
MPHTTCAARDVSLGVLHVPDVHVPTHTLTTQQALPAQAQTQAATSADTHSHTRLSRHYPAAWLNRVCV